MLRTLVSSLSYSPFAAAIVRALHLQSPARRAYYRLFHRAAPVMEVQSGEVSARFWTPDAQEFRVVELAVRSERNTLHALLSLLRPGDVFWDVGSNRGVFALLAARRVGAGGSVVAFEPERTSYAKLTANVNLNALGNVRPMKVALSDREGAGTLALAPRGALSQSAHLVESASGGGETVELAVGDRLPLPPPNVVKIDVEGHEYAVLRGMRAVLSGPECRAVFCELHPDRLPAETNTAAVCQLIESYGFGQLRVGRRGAELQVTATRTSRERPSSQPAQEGPYGAPVGQTR